MPGIMTQDPSVPDPWNYDIDPRTGARTKKQPIDVAGPGGINLYDAKTGTYRTPPPVRSTQVNGPGGMPIQLANPTEPIPFRATPGGGGEGSLADLRTAAGSVGTGGGTASPYDARAVAATGVVRQQSLQDLQAQHQYDTQQTQDTRNYEDKIRLQEQQRADQQRQQSLALLAKLTGNDVSGGATIPSPGPASLNASNLAFARAKDLTGKLTQGSLTALHEAMAGRGLSGSGIEGEGTRQIIGGGAENLANEATGQAVEQSQQGERTATTGYQGAIQQRGQNIQAQQARLQALMAALRF